MTSTTASPQPAADPRSTLGRDVLIGAGLFLLVILLYSQVRSHQFVDLDDTSYITHNPVVSSGLNAKSITWAFTAFHDGYWLPVTWLSYMAVEQFAPHDAGAHALVNVVFHATNAVLLWLVLRYMTGCNGRSLVVAGLLAFHPQHVESVAWIAERKDVLFLFFGLLSIGSYAVWTRATTQWRWFAAALVAYALSLMAKPMLVTLPFILLMLDFWPLARLTGSQAAKAGSISNGHAALTTRQVVLRRIVEKLPFLALALGSSAISYLGKKASGATQSENDFPFDIRVANTLVSYVKHLAHTFFPIDLATPYPYPREFPAFQTIAAMALLAAITGLVIWRGSSRRYLAVGWFWFVLSLLPAVGIVVQVGAQGMADRFIYFPALGLYMMIVWGAAELAETRLPAANRRHLVTAISSVVLVVLAWMSCIQIGYWTDSGTLFTRAASVTENNDQAENNLGLFLAQHDQVAEALPHFVQATQISPNFAAAHHNAGMAYEMLGHPQDALREYNSATDADPNFVDSYFNAGNIFLRMHQPDQAERLYRRALQIRPDYAPAMQALHDMQR